jgi:16S rRNA (guanine966-N2)-methyltransferase
MAKAPNKLSQKTNQLRIIGGQWRGRKLPFPDVDGLRPTGDRLRETLFNWLAPDILHTRCLDLFAGSGALGLEALSRGASHTTFVEFNNLAAKHLAQNLQLLNASNSILLRDNALTFLKTVPMNPFDVVFIDPPFALDLWQPVIDALAVNGFLSATAVIYIESSRDASYSTPADWLLHRNKSSGQVDYRLYYRQATGSNGD